MLFTTPKLGMPKGDSQVKRVILLGAGLAFTVATQSLVIAAVAGDDGAPSDTERTVISPEAGTILECDAKAGFIAVSLSYSSTSLSDGKAVQRKSSGELVDDASAKVTWEKLGSKKQLNPGKLVKTESGQRVDFTDETGAFSAFVNYLLVPGGEYIADRVEWCR